MRIRWYWLSLLCLALFMLWAIPRTHKAVTFSSNVDSHLKVAARASTPETAEEALDNALIYLEDQGLTQGQTDIFYQAPGQNIGIWYQNLIDARDNAKELQELPVDQQALGLLKLSEALNGPESNVPAVPHGISVYHPVWKYVWFALAWLATFSLIGSIVFLVMELDDHSRKGLVIGHPKLKSVA